MDGFLFKRYLNLLWNELLSQFLPPSLVHFTKSILIYELLGHRSLRGSTLADVVAVTQGNDKQRFSMEDRGGEMFIRANQGHSIPLAALDLRPVLSAEAYPIVVHG